MVALFHGTRAVFDRPDFDRLSTDWTNSQYGFGFYTGDYAGDAQERIDDDIRRGLPAIVYEMELPDADFEKKWLESSREVPSEQITRIRDAVREAGRKDILQAWDKTVERGETLTGGIVHSYLNNKSHAEILKKAGIDGYKEGGYYIFKNAAAVPEFKIRSAFNIDRAAAEAELAEMTAHRKTVYRHEDYPQPAHGFFASEMAESGYSDMNSKIKDPQLAAQYLDLVQMTRDPEVFRKDVGFSLRQALGYAVKRATGWANDENERFFGTNLLNLDDAVRNLVVTPEVPAPFQEKLDSFVDCLSDKFSVRAYLKTAEDVEALNRFMEARQTRTQQGTLAPATGQKAGL